MRMSSINLRERYVEAGFNIFFLRKVRFWLRQGGDGAWWKGWAYGWKQFEVEGNLREQSGYHWERSSLPGESGHSFMWTWSFCAAQAEAPRNKGGLVFHTDAGKDWRQEETGMTEGEMVGWHHRLNGHKFEQTLGDSEGQGSLACCRPWSHKGSDTT